IDTSLIEQFMYPKLGPGQMWETVTKIIEDAGGQVIRNAEVNHLKVKNNNISEVTYFNKETNTNCTIKGDYYFSTMPVKNLIESMGSDVPKPVQEIASGLKYRDFITVGLLLDNLELTKYEGDVKDNWIYIQEKEVKIGRLQIFNNWSPYLVSNPNNTWIGLEYFCNEGDMLWSKPDADFIAFAIDELASINIITKEAVLESTIIKVPKAYPAYFGTYSKFDTIREYTDALENLFLIGRNGMHKYNNQDHSMLTAITAVKNIMAGITTKNNLWEINLEAEYHEKK
ncbi:MAG: FAD-dependent oxidoreductase, partial [Oceanihabitans sp.]